MRPITDLIPDVSVSAAGAPDFLVVHALGRALSQFLYATEAWKEWSVDIATSEVVDGEYTWDNHLDPTDTDIADYDWLRVKRVVSVRYGSSTIDPVTPSRIAAADPSWKDTDGAPRMFVSLSDEGGGVRFYPHQATALDETMSARLVMITEATTGIGQTALDALIPELPERLFRKYRETIVKGALAILYRIPGRDWTNFQLSTQLQLEFQADIAVAQVAAARDDNMNTVAVAFNPDW